MLTLAQQLEPRGMSEPEFLEHLYTIATRETWERERDAEIAAGVEKARAGGMHHVSTARSDPRDGHRENPFERGRPPTFEEAAAAASRGERWEHEEPVEEDSPFRRAFKAAAKGERWD